MKTDFERRLARHIDELRWLYMELYQNDAMFAELCGELHRFAEERYLPSHVFAAVGMGNATWHHFENITQSTPGERAAFLELVARETLRTCRA